MPQELENRASRRSEISQCLHFTLLVENTKDHAFRGCSQILKACKHRERVHFSFGFSETPFFAAGRAEAGPFAGKAKSIFASDPPPAVTSPRGKVSIAVMSLIGTAAAPVLDPVRRTISQDRIEAAANRTPADSMPSKFLSLRCTGLRFP